jgi:ligand-binding SRPBCC domain-containing protein
VFEQLKQLWMGIWQHTHTATTTEISPDFGEFTEILDDVSVEMIPVGKFNEILDDVSVEMILLRYC